MKQEGTIVEELRFWKNEFLSKFSDKSYSNHTFSSYNRVIERFLEYSREFQDKVSLSNINSSYILGFLVYMEETSMNYKYKLKNSDKLSNETKIYYLRVLNTFFRFISENNDDLMDFDHLFKKIKIKSSEKREDKITYLTSNEIERLLEYLRDSTSKGCFRTMRNAFLIKLMLFGGLRVSEALNVRLCDIKANVEEGLYYIDIPCAKGGKRQTGHIGMEHIQEEIGYFEYLLSPDSLIMITESKQQLKRENAYGMVNKAFKKAGINKRGCHILRHTLATRLTEQGVNLAIIKKILRHSNISTTTIYAKATSKGISKALAKV